MKQDPVITYIRYTFQGSALLEGEEDSYRYDEEASVGRYADQCREALEEVYPGIKIEVIDTDQGNGMQTQVLALTDSGEHESIRKEEPDRVDSYQQIRAKWRSLEFWEDSEVETSAQAEQELPHEFESVEAVCEQVRKEYRWLVPLDIMSPPQAYRRYKIPIAVID